MNGADLRLASALCATLGAVWTAVMVSNGQTAAALFSAMSVALLIVCYGTTTLDMEGAR